MSEKFSETKEGKEIINEEIELFNNAFGELEDEKILAIRIANISFEAGFQKGQEIIPHGQLKHVKEQLKIEREQGRKEAFEEVEKIIRTASDYGIPYVFKEDFEALKNKEVKRGA